MFIAKLKIALAALLTGLFLGGAMKKDTVRVDDYGDPLPEGVILRLGTLRFRHGGGFIHRLLLTPDGKTLVSSDERGARTVCVWDLATGKLLRQFPGTYQENNIALSADGKLLAIAQSKAVVVWELASGKEVRRFAQRSANAAAFSPDGKMLAAAGTRYTGIHLWNLATGKKITQFRDPKGANLLAFTPDGKTLIAGLELGSKIGLWDVASAKKRQQLDAKEGVIGSFALSPDGATLATGSNQGGIPLWDMATGKLTRKLREEDRKECFAVVFSPDGKTLAAVKRDAKGQEDFLSLWDVAAGKELSRIKGDTFSWSIIFSRDGKTLISASAGSAIRLWDVATGKEVGPAAGSPGFIRLVTMSPDGRTLAYYQPNNIRFWDMTAGREIDALNLGPNGTLAFTFAPDGRTVAASVGEHIVNIWDVKSRKILRRLQWDKKESPYAYWAHAVALAPDGRTLATVDGKDAFIRLWDSVAGKQIHRLTMNDSNTPENRWNPANSIAFSADGWLLAASGRTWDNRDKVRIWEAATGKELPQLTRLMNAPVKEDKPLSRDFLERIFVLPKMAFSADGRMLAKSGRLKTIAVWEAATGQQRLLLKGHEESTECIAFAPDSRTLASASWDNTIRLWDLDNGRELRKLIGHRGKANSLAFSADGKILVSAGDDTTILFWDVAEVTDRKHPHTAPLSAQAWQALWEDLAKDDAAKAYAAMVKMSADGPTTLAALKKRLCPVRPVDPERLAQLLKDLDSDEFTVRESASHELEKLGDVARPAMRQALARRGAPLELRRRLEAICTSLDDISGERLRRLRAIEVLARQGGAAARELLKELAAGAPEALTTMAARAVLKQLRSEPRP